MSKKTKWISLVLAGAMCAVLAAGCGQGEQSESASTPSPAAAPTTITSKQDTVGPVASQPPAASPSDSSSEYADFKTGLKQLQIQGNFMPPMSLDGIDPLNDKVIALTFDDGPHETLTPKLLDILKENEVVATFFVVGTNVEKYPDIVKRTYEEGNEIGTHSWNHPDYDTWKGLSASDKLEQYRKANDAIEAATGLRTMFDRPPGGTMTEDEAKAIGREQIIWSQDPKDWVKANRDPDTIYTNVIEGGDGSQKTGPEGYVADGGVILSHDIHATTVEAYDKIIKELKNQGYKFVTITQMMQIAEIRGGDVKYKFYNAPTAEQEAQASASASATSGENE
ncbi:MAG: polysaccharide deacetylase family protein [Christensenella sp.]|uniref:polysaccharide deacetylase family protein n=1 Tax=Christensenella sp. TaxID=1935934 RepID=UPI002B1F6995|nr:polysaccharide deacetylase family protein [Christensenella sp.]MEA5003772.1 polysaccharide deacetylase family protein [Christensenella sp.]